MKHDYFQDEKLKYEDIEIPDELLFVVRRTVAADRKKKAVARRNRILKTAGSVAAVLFLCLTIGVNSSYAFAETAVKIPVVKEVAQAVVVRSYRSEIVAVYAEYKVSNRTEKMPEESPEKQPEEPEIVPAESGNDVLPAPEETPEQPPTEQVTPEEPDALDVWKAEMTVEKLRKVTELYTPELEEKYAETPEKLRTILLAELKEQDISLYGYHEDGKVTGVALRVGDTHQYFDWHYMNESGKLPEIICEDMDGDETEEILVFLYNGAMEKRELSKEDIVAPEEDANVEKGDASGTGKEDASDAQETDSSERKEEADAEIPTVSENEAEKPAEGSKRPEQPAGELWVVSSAGEDGTATVLSINDYESQILHQIKAAYDAQTGKLQLYLAEEPFGEPIRVSFENKKPQELTSEGINLAPERKFVIDKGLLLQFRIEAFFVDKNGEKMSVILDRKLKTGISLKDGSLVLGEIKSSEGS